ncbi:MAG: hypothetical protein D4R73_11200 [Deltaproteobacteria bacterium]|nr:MAG: hypothetical protein D4R73_11200 [Deltaproteobacteria bacterium]
MLSKAVPEVISGERARRCGGHRGEETNLILIYWIIRKDIEKQDVVISRAKINYRGEGCRSARTNTGRSGGCYCKRGAQVNEPGQGAALFKEYVKGRS